MDEVAAMEVTVAMGIVLKQGERAGCYGQMGSLAVPKMENALRLT